MKVINIFLIISIFTFVNVAHAMDDEYELDFSQKSPRSIGGLISEEIVRCPGYERKTLRLKNVTPEKFELLKNVLFELLDAGGIKKIIYSYDESLQKMPMSVDEIMNAISSKKRIVIEKEGIKRWPEEQAPKSAELNNKAAKFYQDSKVDQEKIELFKTFYSDDSHSDSSD